jgi:riboflavin synthase
MFSGLVVERGRVAEPPAPSGRGGVRLVLAHGLALGEILPVGASLAVSGTCLTVVERGDGRSTVELSAETLARTTLGGLKEGSAVNLEPALRVGDPLGGHWVQGHVDGRTEVVGRDDRGDHCTMSFALPPALAPFVVEKGSVAVDGVSLTVAGRGADRFSVALIPHTLNVTTLGDLQAGAAVNLEVDILAKYIHQALAARGLVPPSPLTVPAGEAR